MGVTTELAASNVNEATSTVAESCVAPRQRRVPSGEPPVRVDVGAADAVTSVLPDRYEDRCLLGRGGFGEVRRVYDKKLDRLLAMKILRSERADSPRLRARFFAEVRLTAKLDHPEIIAVLDDGELPDGRLWFTMPEVRGRTLAAVIHEAFAEHEDGARRTVLRWRLLQVFARVCDAMAHAHGRGIIHRDLKPENIMVGDLGRVWVMDWGLARFVEQAEDEEEQAVLNTDCEDSSAWGYLTRPGEVMGTPAYMAPEQARGKVERHGPAMDVFALGAILFHLLTGQRPIHDVAGARFDTAAESVLAQAGAAPELVSICQRAMAREIEDRHPSAAELVVEIEAFLSGAMRRERALERLHASISTRPAIVEMRARAASLRAEAAAVLARTRPFDPIANKRPGWALEDEAERLDREAALGEAAWIQGVYGALALDPDLPEAHEALADHYKEKLARAERARRHEEALRCEALLRSHDRGRYAAFLSGEGVLSLVTDPPGAKVVLERYVLRERRLVAEVEGALGTTPIHDVTLPAGSYRLRVSAEGRSVVRIPVRIDRGERWDNRPPGSEEPYPIPLPRLGEIDDGEVYVPAGWAWTGGDPDAPDSLKAARVWVDGFVVGRFPVTNEEYILFLNDLVRSGREREALIACPRPNRALVGQAGSELSFVRRADGLFELDPTDTVERWLPRSPAVLMTWHGAVEYTKWLRGRTGRPYRLLHELEREKAVRGADGRLFPWGDFLDPTWTCMLSSHEKQPMRAEVDAYPEDCSPFGMRGGAGNSHDFCLNVWTHEGPSVPDGRILIPSVPPEGDEHRAVRGGGWSSVENHCRAAARFAMRPDQRHNSTGLRVARSYPYETSV